MSDHTYGGWETLDVEALMRRRDEQTMSGGVGGGGTTTANVGAYQVPLGRPLRREFPVSADDHDHVVPKSKGPAKERREDVQTDLEYAWAMSLLR